MTLSAGGEERASATQPVGLSHIASHPPSHHLPCGLLKDVCEISLDVSLFSVLDFYLRNSCASTQLKAESANTHKTDSVSFTQTSHTTTLRMMFGHRIAQKRRNKMVGGGEAAYVWWVLNDHTDSILVKELCIQYGIFQANTLLSTPRTSGMVREKPKTTTGMNGRSLPG